MKKYQIDQVKFTNLNDGINAAGKLTGYKFIVNHGETATGFYTDYHKDQYCRALTLNKTLFDVIEVNP